MTDLEAKLRIDLKAAGSLVSGTGVDRLAVERRVLERADRRRRRRRAAGALVTGTFLVLAISAAVALSGTRSTRTLGQPEDFTAFCAVARKLSPNGTDETGRNPAQQVADAERRVDDLRRASPVSLRRAFDTVLAANRGSAQPTSEQRDAALKEIDAELRTRCRTTIKSLGGVSQGTESKSATGTETESRSSSGSGSSNGTVQSDSCLNSQTFRIFLVRKDALTRIEARGLQPGSVVRAQLVTAATTVLIGLPPGQPPSPPGDQAGADGTYKPTNIGFRPRSVGDPITVRITFTPAGGAERTDDLTL